ncbi:hypothetical protein [Actinoplanes sichuanensis]|uniref:Uncharacterized protein n=1 Tax=Actinoplanes sichuanensis TaxID=512349 RepID=A0ABW4A1M1_9ACTN|nr:hypothetical protein [Actinoplanes sichuanensis]
MTITRPYISRVTGRTPGSGPVVAVLTDGPTDMAVAAHAADLAARSGTLLIAAAAVHNTGFSLNALLCHARNQRLHADSIAIVGRVTPILHTAGVAWMRSTLLLPAGTDALRAVPITALQQLVNRYGAVAVVTALPLSDPTGLLHPAERHPGAPANTATDRHATF